MEPQSMDRDSPGAEKWDRKGELVFKKLRRGEIDDATILKAAARVVENADRHGVLLRLLGAAGFVTHCPMNKELFALFSRKLTDIDVITYGSCKSSNLENALAEIGFERQRHYVWHAAYREIYANAEGLFVDVFRDTLSFSHEIRFKGRLELDSPTVPLEELLLEKLQIHHITEKDFKDIVILLLEHDVGAGGDRERVDSSFVSGVLSDDWGFYHDAVENLGQAKAFLEEASDVLAAADVRNVRGRIDRLIDAIEKAPKSARWKKRAKKGTKRIWYTEVGELQQGI
jgi:hypothetical protein